MQISYFKTGDIIPKGAVYLNTIITSDGILDTVKHYFLTEKTIN